jgi:hypothetical protein
LNVSTENDDPPDLAILNDVNHPDHAAWQRGDPALVARVENAFKLKYGTEETTEPTADEPPLDDEMLALKQRYETGGDAPAPVDAAAETYRVETELRQRWGDDYDMNVSVAMGVATDLFGDDQDLLMRVGSAIGDDVRAMEMLLKLAKRTK